MVLLTAIILGFILDFIFGDPRWLPHPICFIGKLISITEKAVRRFCGEKPEGLLMGGFVLVVIVLTVVRCTEKRRFAGSAQKAFVDCRARYG